MKGTNNASAASMLHWCKIIKKRGQKQRHEVGILDGHKRFLWIMEVSLEEVAAAAGALDSFQVMAVVGVTTGNRSGRLFEVRLRSTGKMLLDTNANEAYDWFMGQLKELEKYSRYSYFDIRGFEGQENVSVPVFSTFNLGAEKTV